MSENLLYALGFVAAAVLLPFAWPNMNQEPETYYSGATPEYPSWEPELETQNTLPPTLNHE